MVQQQTTPEESTVTTPQVATPTEALPPQATLLTEHTPMESEEVEQLLATLEKEALKRKRRNKLIVGGILAFYGLMILIYIVVGIETGKFHSEFLSQLATMSGVFGAVAAATQGQKKAAKELAQFEDIRAVGPLAEALEYQDKGLRSEAEAALIRLLPRLQASDAGHLNEDQRKCLHRALYCKNTSLVLAILKALEQVGDEKALPYVEKLAEGRTRRSRDRQIQADAASCLPYLKQRAEESRSRQTLLRAASALDTPADILLRPVMASADTPSEELLRPSQEAAEA
jgi:hypothetical protein